MKIVVNGIEVIFKKSPARIEDSQIWDATIFYDQHELDFEFEERLILSNNPEKNGIDEKLVKDIVKHVLDNLAEIQLKGPAVLAELHKQVFNEEDLVRKKGYFKAGGIELKEVRYLPGTFSAFPPYFEYDVYYFLESEENFLMDEYHSYYGHFSNHNRLTMIGVSRIG